NALEVAWIKFEIWNMDYLFRVGDAAKRYFRVRMHDRHALCRAGDCERHAMMHDRPEPFVLGKPQNSGIGFTNARRVLEDCSKHRLELAGGTGDDGQHLRGRSP